MDTEIQDTQKQEQPSQDKAQRQVDEYANAKLSPLLLKFAIPAIIGMLCGGVQNIICRIFVGQACGPEALAAVQIGFPITTVFMALAMMIGMGSMTLISIRLGQQRRDDADKLLGQATFLLFLIPLICTLATLPFLDPVLRFIGSSDAVLPYAHDYFQIMLFSMVFFAMSVGLNNIIRAQGAPKIAMGTQILAAVLTIGLNWLFVWVLPWGVRGSALGMLLGNFFSLFWIFGYFMRKVSYLKIRMKYLRIFPHTLRAILPLGLTPFLVQGANAIQQFIMNISLVTYGGDSAMTALSITMAISSIVLLPFLGFSQGATPIMGYNYGAKNFDRIKGTLLRAMGYGTAFAALGVVCILIWAPQMVHLFITGNPEVEALSVHALKLFFSCLVFIPVGVCSGALFQATGKVVRSMFLALSRQFIFFIPLLLILPHWFGLDGCWLAAPASDVAAFIISIIVVYMGLKSIKREMETIGVGKLVA